MLLIGHGTIGIALSLYMGVCGMSKKSRANKAAAQQQKPTEGEVQVTDQQPVVDESAITGEPPAEDQQVEVQTAEQPVQEDTGEVKAAEQEPEVEVSTAPPKPDKKNELEKRIARLEKSVGKIEAIAKRLAAV